jgi:hypothetical protein
MRLEFFYQIKDLARYLVRNWSARIWTIFFFGGIGWNSYNLIFSLQHHKSWWSSAFGIVWWFGLLYFLEYRQYKKALRDSAKKLMMMDPKERAFYNEWGEYDTKKRKAYLEELKKNLAAMAAQMGTTTVRGSVKIGGKVWKISKVAKKPRKSK